MCTQEYPVGNWVMFYKNTWARKVLANTIDVQTDMALKAENAEQSVEYGNDAMGNPVIIAVKHRLELRKVELGKALKILEAIKSLDGLTAEQLTEKYWSADALKMDPAVAAEALGTKEPATVQYVVIADGGVTLNGTEDVTPKGTAIMLDPTDPETAALLEAGTIELATTENTQQEQEQQQEEKPDTTDQQQEQQETQATVNPSYTVLADTITLADGTVHNKGQVITLSDADAAPFLASGSIGLTPEQNPDNWFKVLLDNTAIDGLFGSPFAAGTEINIDPNAQSTIDLVASGNLEKIATQ